MKRKNILLLSLLMILSNFILGQTDLIGVWIPVKKVVHNEMYEPHILYHREQGNYEEDLSKWVYTFSNNEQYVLIVGEDEILKGFWEQENEILTFNGKNKVRIEFLNSNTFIMKYYWCFNKKEPNYQVEFAIEFIRISSKIPAYEWLSESAREDSFYMRYNDILEEEYFVKQGAPCQFD